MTTSDGWSSRYESGNCIVTRSVPGGLIEVRDTETDGSVLVTEKAWEAFLSSVRAEALKVAADEMESALRRHFPGAIGALGWLRDRANALTAVRDDTKGTSDGER